jgi:hypothetical protein
MPFCTQKEEMMAILTLTVDTDENTVSLTVDGADVANVGEVNVYNWGSNTEPRFYFSVTTSEQIGGVNKLTRLSAREDPSAKEAIASGIAKASSAHDGFVEYPYPTKAQEQIAEWFQSTRRR